MNPYWQKNLMTLIKAAREDAQRRDQWMLDKLLLEVTYRIEDLEEKLRIVDNPVEK